MKITLCHMSAFGCEPETLARIPVEFSIHYTTHAEMCQKLSPTVENTTFLATSPEPLDQVCSSSILNPQFAQVNGRDEKGLHTVPANLIRF